MLRTTIQWINDRLIERLMLGMDSLLSATTQRMVILGHVENHDQLEQEARRYEAEGKPHLAKMIRQQAEKLALPTVSVPEVVETPNIETPSSAALPQNADDEPAPTNKLTKSKPTRKGANQ